MGSHGNARWTRTHDCFGMAASLKQLTWALCCPKRNAWTARGQRKRTIQLIIRHNARPGHQPLVKPYPTVPLSFPIGVIKPLHGMSFVHPHSPAQWARNPWPPIHRLPPRCLQPKPNAFVRLILNSARNRESQPTCPATPITHTSVE